MWWSEGLLSNKGRYTTMKKKSEALKSFERYQKLQIKNIKELQAEGYVFSKDYINSLARQWKRAPKASELDDYKRLYNKKEMRHHVVGRTFSTDKLTGIASTYEGQDVSVSVQNPRELAGLTTQGLQNIIDLKSKGISTKMPMYLYEFLHEMAGTEDFEAGKRYRTSEGVFKIAEDYKGGDLTEYVDIISLDIKKASTKAAFERMLEIPGMVEGTYDLFQEQWHEKAQNKFISNREKELSAGNKKWEGLKLNDPNFMTVAKNVLNQSHMWRIASKDLAYKYKGNMVVKNRGTHEANYMQLVKMYEDVDSLDTSHIDEFIQMIDNEEDMTTITATVNRWIEEAYT